MITRLGHIELWNTNSTQCRQKVPPLLNRLVIFTCTDDAFHGHPEPLEAPDGMMRIGFQLVLFTTTPPADDERFAAAFLPPVRPIEVGVDGSTVPQPFNSTANDPDWYHRKLYKSPHSAVFQVPCNDQLKWLCETQSMGLAEPKHCECNFDSIVSAKNESIGYGR